LRKFHRSWCGLDAVVSLGRFSCKGAAVASLLRTKAPAELPYDSDLDG